MAAPRSLTEKQEKEIAKAYAKGGLTSQLALQYGVHSSTIRNAIERQGGTLRPRGGVPGVSKSVYKQDA